MEPVAALWQFLQVTCPAPCYVFRVCRHQPPMPRKPMK
jgi:hypothetical protein